MILYKQEVINKLAEKTGLYKKDVRAVLLALNELVYEEMDVMIKNTSHYLKRYNGKSLTTGMMDLANYTVFRKFDETHRKVLFTGTYDEVVSYIRNIS